jgi:uncharacterized protein (DUF305 family)
MRRITTAAVLLGFVGLAWSAVVSSAGQRERYADRAAARMHAGMAAATEPAGPFIIDSAKSGSELLDQSMAVMARDMKQAPMTGDPDHDFAAMMIPHHQGAVDMAKVEVLHGKNPALRRLAQEIIVTQRSEIDVLRMQLHREATGRSSGSN